MKGLSLETIMERVFGLNGRGHEGRIQKLEKAAGVALALGFPYAILEGGGSLPGPSGGKWWWDLTPPSGTDFTNAPATFSNGTLAISAGGGNANSGTFHGLSILQPGMYIAFKSVIILSLYSDTTLRAITLYQSAGLTYTSDMAFGDQNHVNQGHGQHFEVWSVDAGTAPTATILLNSASTEASAYTCTVTLFVVKLDTTSIAL